MYVACSTQCFGANSLPEALKQIGDLHFSKVDVALHEDGPHIKPSEVLADLAKAQGRLRNPANVVPVAFHVRFGPVDPTMLTAQLKAICKLARLTTVPLVCIAAAPAGSDFEQEVERLTELQRLASAEGVILTIETNAETLTADPRVAIDLCHSVRGLGLTLDPSYYLIGPYAEAGYDDVVPLVRHVRLRDTSVKNAAYQVRVGQGDVEYSKLLGQLERVNYNRALTVDIRDEREPDFAVTNEVRKLKFLLESLV